MTDRTAADPEPPPDEDDERPWCNNPRSSA